MNEYWIEIDGYKYELEKRWIPRRETYDEEINEYGRYRIKNRKVEPATFEFKEYSTKNKPALDYILKRFSSFKCGGTNLSDPLIFVYEKPYEIEGNICKFYNGDFVR